MSVKIHKLPTTPTNTILTGIAGTGKTHQLLQIQALYDEVITSSWKSWRIKQVKNYSWCDVICAVLLQEDRMMTVPEIVNHQLITDKVIANERDGNIHQTLWSQLNSHAHPESITVNSAKRSASYFFDKNEASQWYLLEEVKASLNERLADLLSLYDPTQEIQHEDQHTISRSCLVSFHQAYGYDEFVEGIRPQVNSQTGQMQYNIQAGAFLALCDKAAADPNHRYAMLIDEINRANTAQVFGELMSLIEPSKRAGCQTPMSVRLAYSGRGFSVPSNVDIYATMNTQDYSLATLDTAFRRRFNFITCLPDSSLLKSIQDSFGDIVELSQLMDILNQRLSLQLGSDAQIGHAYFMNIENIGQLAERLYKQIIPYIVYQLKMNANAGNMSAMMSQILYGTPDGMDKEDSLLYDSRASIKPEPNTIRYHPQSNPTVIQLSDAFIAIVENIDNLNIPDSTTHTMLNGTERLFLTAKPYQRLYAAN